MADEHTRTHQPRQALARPNRDHQPRLECLLVDPAAEYATNQAAFHTTGEGFYAGPVAGEALKLAGFDGVGCADSGIVKLPCSRAMTKAVPRTTRRRWLLN